MHDGKKLSSFSSLLVFMAELQLHYSKSFGWKQASGGSRLPCGRHRNPFPGGIKLWSCTGFDQITNDTFASLCESVIRNVRILLCKKSKLISRR